MSPSASRTLIIAVIASGTLVPGGGEEAHAHSLVWEYKEDPTTSVRILLTMRSIRDRRRQESCCPAAVESRERSRSRIRTLEGASGVTVIEDHSCGSYEVSGGRALDLLGVLGRRGQTVGWMVWMTSLDRIRFRVRFLSNEPGTVVAQAEVSEAEIAAVTDRGLPRWDEFQDAPAELMEAWCSFIAALAAHEEAHRAIVVAGAWSLAARVARVIGVSSGRTRAEAAARAIENAWREIHHIHRQGADSIRGANEALDLVDAGPILTAIYETTGRSLQIGAHAP